MSPHYHATTTRRCKKAKLIAFSSTWARIILSGGWVQNKKVYIEDSLPILFTGSRDLSTLLLASSSFEHTALWCKRLPSGWRRKILFSKFRYLYAIFTFLCHTPEMPIKIRITWSKWTSSHFRWNHLQSTQSGSIYQCAIEALVTNDDEERLFRSVVKGKIKFYFHWTLARKIFLIVVGRRKWLDEIDQQ